MTVIKKENITLKDIVRIPSKCRVCEAQGEVNTLKWIAEDTDNVVGQQLEEKGYVENTCPACMVH